MLGIRGDRLITVRETWRNVKEMAMRVAVECVIPGPHFGGWGWVGGGDLLVSVIGRDEG